MPRFNPDLTTKYYSLIKAGKPPKVAITAIMRNLTYQPAFLVSDLIFSGKLVPLELEQNTAELTIYALFPKSNRDTAKVSSFLDFVVAKWKNGENWCQSALNLDPVSASVL